MIYLQAVAGHFSLPAGTYHIEPLGKGLINDTYRLTSGDAETAEQFVLQKINRHVFRIPEDVMNNLVTINRHLETKGSPHQEVIISKHGLPFHIDDNGEYWRVTRYVRDTCTIYEVTDPGMAREAASAYGSFLNDLHDLDIGRIRETIPGFHNYHNRIKTLEEAVERDPLNRLRGCSGELKDILQNLHYLDKFNDLNLPLRVIHGDAKIDNILFDCHTMKNRMVIDLDISMPASILYDFGDMVRSFTNTRKEDDPRTEEVGIKLDIFDHITAGFLDSTRDFIHDKEKNNLILGARIVILIQAIRNFTDYILGDLYYKIDHERHNLDRSRNQLALLQALKSEEDELMKRIDRFL